MITPPELKMPVQYDLTEWCAANYIGKPLAKLCREAWDKVKEWAEAPIVSNAFGEPETKQASRQANQGQGQRGGASARMSPFPPTKFPGEDEPVELKPRVNDVTWPAWVKAVSVLGWVQERRKGHLLKW